MSEYCKLNSSLTSNSPSSMADTHESGMQIVTRRIELAKEAMESGRALEMSRSKLCWTIPSGVNMSSLGAFVDCLSSVSKSVFEHDKGRYLTTTLFTFLLQRPPTQPILFLMCDYNSDELTARELITSEFHIKKFVGLLGLISLHDACMSLPPLPRHELSAEERLDDVATLLYYLDIRGPYLVRLLLNLLIEGNIYDKLISVMALGAIPQQSGEVKHLVKAGVMGVFSKILKQGPMLLQAEVAHVISKCLAIDPTFRDKLPLDDLVTSLVSLLQVEVAEEHLQEDINKATSVLSIVAARHNSNKRKVAAERNEKSMSGEHNQPQQEVSPHVNERIRETAARALGALAKNNTPACHIIVEKRATLCFAVLLQNGRLDVKLSSAMALMEITAVAEKESDLRRSGFKHSSHAHKTVVEQLMRIIKEALDVKSGMHRYVTAELLIPCIKTIGNLAATFQVTQPIIPLVHLLEPSNNRESINCEVIKETLAALSKFTCRDHSFLHLDHSKAIVSLGGLYHILLLAEHEDIGVEKHALVLLCYVAVDALGNESDELKKVVSAINLASRKGHFSKDEAVKALLQQTKRRLSQLMLV